MSFYDWYCDLPPASPQTWGEQTDVPEIGRLVQRRASCIRGRLERAADAHAGRPLLHRGALPRHQERRHLPRLLGGVEVRRHLDLAEAGHRRRRSRMAMSHVILSEFHVDRQVRLLRDYGAPVHRHTDAGASSRKQDGKLVPGPLRCAPPILRIATLGEASNPEWKTVAFDEASATSIGRAARLDRFRWGEQRKLESREQEGRRQGRDAAPVARRRSATR